MLHQFTFIEDIEVAFARHSFALFHNAVSVTYVYMGQTTDPIYVQYDEVAIGKEESSISPEKYKELQRIAALLIQSSAWKNHNEIFEHTSRNSIQLNFDAIERANYLTLTLTFPVDQVVLVLLEFDLSTANYGMQREVRNLNQTEKYILAGHFRASAQKFLSDWDRNNAALQWLSRQDENRKRSLSKLYEEKERAQDFQVRNIKAFVYHCLKTLGKEINKQIRITDKGLGIFFEKSLDLARIEHILKESVLLAMNTRQRADAIVLDQYDLLMDMDEPLTLVEDQKPLKTQGRFEKAENLLNRYEAALERVLELDLKPTGKHIGLHCSPSISNAAISDSVKKYRYPIVELLTKHPERWPLLRTRFRTIQNVLLNGPHEAKKMA